MHRTTDPLHVVNRLVEQRSTARRTPAGVATGHDRAHREAGAAVRGRTPPTSATSARCSSAARSSAPPRCPTPRASAEISMEIMRRNGVAVDLIRAVDRDIATGVWPDMTEHGWDTDDWPAIFEQVMAADILVLLIADLARREVVGVHPRDRAALRQLRPAQRRRPVRVLRPRRRLPHHRQRGRHQALLDEHPLLAAAPRLHDPAAGRRRLDRRGRSRARRTSTSPAAAATTTSPTGTPRS